MSTRPQRSAPPPVGLSQTIPLDIRRDLVKINSRVNDVQSVAQATSAVVQTKFGPEDLLTISQGVRQNLSAGGGTELNLTGLPGIAGQAATANANQLQGVSVAATQPTAGNVLAYSATLKEWLPTVLFSNTVSTTVPLAKLTTGGSNGQLQFNAAGLLIGHTNPT